MSIRLVTAATTPAVTLAEAKRHVHAEHHTDDDSYLEALVEVATRNTERWLGIAIAEQEWELSLDDFPAGKITLPKAPLISVDTIEYDNTAGTPTAYATFREFGVASEGSGYVMPAVDTDWPDTNEEPECVRIGFTAGFAAVPPDIKHAILLLVGDWFEHREDASEVALRPMPNGVDRLLMNYRNWAWARTPRITSPNNWSA